MIILKIKTTITIIILSVLFVGCFSQKKSAKLDLEIDRKNLITIEGKISENKNSSKDFYLILFKEIIKDNKKINRLVDFSTYSKPGKFSFNVTKGTYFLYVCQNTEEITDKRVGFEFISEKFILNKFNTKKKLKIKMPSSPVLINKDNILISTTNDYSIFKKFNQIKRTTLNNTIFNRKNSSLGLWKPLDFYSKIGGGVYFLEKFSKNKIPILFVHGMNGTPKDFSYIISSIDKNRYQPIVYYYPTGINLNYAVDGLKYTITNIKNKYKIKKLIIIAHSMGGLVSRGFIHSLNKEVIIDKFITLSTPWNGQKYTEYGGKAASRIVPSFGNMLPGSAYQTNILSKKFPKNLNHYLLFGYKAKSSFILDNSNDGVISLSSQLYNKAQEQAHLIYGYDETHSSILKSKEVMLKINTIINN